MENYSLSWAAVMKMVEMAAVSNEKPSGALPRNMAARSLLDQKHRATYLEADPRSLERLQTRTPEKNWMIHPGWVDRLKWAGLLPFARLVEATCAVWVPADGHPQGVLEGVNSARLNYDAALITCLVDRWRPETTRSTFAGIEQFGYPAVPMTAAQITRSLEAYLMWLLGKTMFTDNHRNTISARYIPIAQEIAEATEAEHIT
ncbi:hypothetical protein QYE76_030946 [Lolium multiflorum]|uniref:Uncharacterized protein n=1 Tax=Lolium multiflorum TaxID=4521 RepID=A0AAD8QUA2_LOLMU|nr:hypothetical protein QYE76_030946 [Lolium multiflorum]